MGLMGGMGRIVIARPETLSAECRRQKRILMLLILHAYECMAPSAAYPLNPDVSVSDGAYVTA
jgi:hypothetical protein